jgi:hypothetical protein
MITTAQSKASRQPEGTRRGAWFGRQLIETEGLFGENRFVLPNSEVAQSQSCGDGGYHYWKN